jgi:hypothetical protein
MSQTSRLDTLFRQKHGTFEKMPVEKHFFKVRFEALKFKGFNKKFHATLE